LYETVERPSVCLSVCPSYHSVAAGLLLSAEPAGIIDRQRQRPGAEQRRHRSTTHNSKLRSAANAVSVALTADVGSWTQTCRMRDRVAMALTDNSSVAQVANSSPISEEPGYDYYYVTDAENFTCKTYDFAIEALLMGLLCAFGFVGNSLSTVCLLRWVCR